MSDPDTVKQNDDGSFQVEVNDMIGAAVSDGLSTDSRFERTMEVARQFQTIIRGYKEIKKEKTTRKEDIKIYIEPIKKLYQFHDNSAENFNSSYRNHLLYLFFLRLVPIINVSYMACLEMIWVGNVVGLFNECIHISHISHISTADEPDLVPLALENYKTKIIEIVAEIHFLHNCDIKHRSSIHDVAPSSLTVDTSAASTTNIVTQIRESKTFHSSLSIALSHIADIVNEMFKYWTNKLESTSQKTPTPPPKKPDGVGSILSRFAAAIAKGQRETSIEEGIITEILKESTHLNELSPEFMKKSSSELYKLMRNRMIKLKLMSAGKKPAGDSVSDYTIMYDDDYVNFHRLHSNYIGSTKLEPKGNTSMRYKFRLQLDLNGKSISNDDRTLYLSKMPLVAMSTACFAIHDSLFHDDFLIILKNEEISISTQLRYAFDGFIGAEYADLVSDKEPEDIFMSWKDCDDINKKKTITEIDVEAVEADKPITGGRKISTIRRRNMKNIKKTIKRWNGRGGEFNALSIIRFVMSAFSVPSAAAAITLGKFIANLGPGIQFSVSIGLFVAYYFNFCYMKGAVNGAVKLLWSKTKWISLLLAVSAIVVTIVGGVTAANFSNNLSANFKTTLAGNMLDTRMTSIFETSYGNLNTIMETYKPDDVYNAITGISNSLSTGGIDTFIKQSSPGISATPATTPAVNIAVNKWVMETLKPISVAISDSFQKASFRPMEETMPALGDKLNEPVLANVFGARDSITQAILDTPTMKSYVELNKDGKNKIGVARNGQRIYHDFVTSQFNSDPIAMATAVGTSNPTYAAMLSARNEGLPYLEALGLVVSGVTDTNGKYDNAEQLLNDINYRMQGDYDKNSERLLVTSDSVYKSLTKTMTRDTPIDKLPWSSAIEVLSKFTQKLIDKKRLTTPHQTDQLKGTVLKIVKHAAVTNFPDNTKLVDAIQNPSKLAAYVKECELTKNDNCIQQFRITVRATLKMLYGFSNGLDVPNDIQLLDVTSATNIVCSRINNPNQAGFISALTNAVVDYIPVELGTIIYGEISKLKDKNIFDIAKTVSGIAATIGGSPAGGVLASTFVDAIHNYRTIHNSEKELEALSNIGAHILSVIKGSSSFLNDPAIANVMDICQADQLKMIVAKLTNPTSSADDKSRALAVFETLPSHKDMFEKILKQLTENNRIKALKDQANLKSIPPIMQKVGNTINDITDNNPDMIIKFFAVSTGITLIVYAAHRVYTSKKEKSFTGDLPNETSKHGLWSEFFQQFRLKMQFGRKQRDYGNYFARGGGGPRSNNVKKKQNITIKHKLTTITKKNKKKSTKLKRVRTRTRTMRRTVVRGNIFTKNKKKYKNNKK